MHGIGPPPEPRKPVRAGMCSPGRREVMIMVHRHVTVAGDARAMTDDQLTAVSDLMRLLEAERRPYDPPREEFAGWVRALPAHYAMTVVWAPYAHRELRGVAVCTAMRGTGNEHLLEVAGGVRPGHRRRGVGSALLTRVLDVARDAGQGLLLFRTGSRPPGAAEWARHLGAIPAQVEEMSRLDLRRADRSLLESWVLEGPRRAPAYELVTL